MMLSAKLRNISSCVCFCLALNGSLAVGEEDEPVSFCGTGPSPRRVTIRHIEPNGIGYTQGYTTLEGFFAAENLYRDAWIPFLDLRGHVFNDGKFAANAGFGMRYLGPSRVWGINGYWDYRDTHHRHYNQASLGLETLGAMWDFRLNGYLTVGSKASRLYGASQFSYFQDHYAYLSKRQEYALRGCNAEAAVHIDHYKNAPISLAAGPYYLEGKGKIAWGGQLRMAIDLFDSVRLEGNASYDNVFKWIGQGQLGITLAFGRKREIPSSSDHCSNALVLNTRALQRVDRNEIVPVNTKKVHSPAINPATGQPWVFWFVNNTSHSAGTYESPFNTLLAAQDASSANQAIYVYPGDGTTNGMDQGIVLQTDQMFLGASIAHPLLTTWGTITLPPLAASTPNISNSIGSGNVITLQTNNTIAGFNITTAVDNGSGIYATAISNLTTYENTFSTQAGITTNGIYLLNSSGPISITDNSFSGFSNINASNNGNGIFIELDGATLNDLTVDNNFIANISNPSNSNGGNGIFLYTSTSGTFTNVNITNNTVSNAANTTLIYNLATIKTLNMTGNFSNSSPETNLIYNQSEITTLNVTKNIWEGLSNVNCIDNNTGSQITTFNFTNNTLKNITTADGIYLSPNTITALYSTNNTFTDFTSSSGIYIDNPTTISILSSTNDTFINFNASSGIASVVPIANLTVNDCIFENLNNNAFGISYTPSSGNAILQINNNTFSGSGTLGAGYAATIAQNADTLCVDFTGNTATPTSSPAPYAFIQGGSGVFNRTVGSDNTTNTGDFSLSGTINAPGSCVE